MISEEEVANVRDSFTVGLLSKEQNLGGEMSGFGGLLASSRIGQAEVYTQDGGEGTEEGKNWHLWPENQTKREVDNGSYGGIFLAT